MPKPGAPMHKAKHPAKHPGAPPGPAGEVYAHMQQAAILQHLGIVNLLATAGPVPKAEFRARVRRSLNVNQWKQRLTTRCGFTPAQANIYGTAEAACNAAFASCPFC